MSEQPERNQEARQSDNSSANSVGPNTPQETDHKCKAAKKIANAIKQPFNWVSWAWTWHVKLAPIDRFTFWVAIFTAVLATAAVMQYAAFMESERAFVIVEDFISKLGEISNEPSQIFYLWLKNVGKHVADFKEIRGIGHAGIKHPRLPDEPNYAGAALYPSLPIAPEGKFRVRLQVSGNPELTASNYASFISGKGRLQIFIGAAQSEFPRTCLTSRGTVRGGAHALVYRARRHKGDCKPGSQQRLQTTYRPPGFCAPISHSLKHAMTLAQR